MPTLRQEVYFIMYIKHFLSEHSIQIHYHIFLMLACIARKVVRFLSILYRVSGELTREMQDFRISQRQIYVWQGCPNLM